MAYKNTVEFIEKKAAGGEIAVPPEPEPIAEDGEVVDIVGLLKKSLEDARKQA